MCWCRHRGGVLGHPGPSQGGEWEMAPWSSSSRRGLWKHVVSFPHSTPVVITATPVLEGSSPRGTGQLSKRKCRVDAVEWLSQGRKKQSEGEIGLPLKCSDSEFSVLSMTLSFLCWFSNWQGHMLRTSSVTCGIRWHLDDFFQLNLVAKEKPFSLLNPGPECTISNGKVPWNEELQKVLRIK